MKRLSLTMSLLAVAAMFWGNTAEATVFTDIQHEVYNGSVRTDGNLTVGNTFTTPAEPQQVSHLGFIDLANPNGAAGDGLVAAHDVGLWEGSTLVATVTVPAGTAALLDSGFRWVALPSPLSLTGDQQYYLGATVSANTDSWLDVGFPAMDPDYVSGLSSNAFAVGGALTRPTGTGGQRTYGAPNIAFMEQSVVPEPGAIVLALIGIVGLGLVTLRRRRLA